MSAAELSQDAPLLVVPRARLADVLRCAASAVFGIAIAAGCWAAMLDAVWLVVAGVLACNAAFLGVKLADRRPALVATPAGLTVFRFPGPSAVIRWRRLAEIAYQRMRVKRVLFLGVVPEDGGAGALQSIELASTDFAGKGAEIAARLIVLRDRFA